MGKAKISARRPFLDEQHDEQHILEHLSVRLIKAAEQKRFDQLLIEHHYLHSAKIVGEQMRYVATYKGQWLALAAWGAAALHLRARDAEIGWDDEQRRRRLSLLANNTRLLVLPECHHPNLVSRFMKLMLARLNGDWQQLWKHPLALVESFVDPQLFQGTCYKVSGWSKLGQSAGYARRSGRDYYQAHDRPKDLWVRELAPGAMKLLRAKQLPPAWAVVEEKSAPRCRAKVPEIRSLVGHLREMVPEFRRKQALAYPLAGMLALIAMATFCGVVRGQRDLAAFGRTLSQGQLRALRFRTIPGTRKVRAPDETTFFRVLNGVDEALLEKALLAWQEQVLGPARDKLIALDGKKLRHARGVEIVSAYGTESGRWLGSVCTGAKSNEIPAARTLLSKLNVQGCTVIADAIHTQLETAQAILYESGADYIFTVKDNQKTLHKTVAGLMEPQPFSPSSGAAAAGLAEGTQSWAQGDPRPAE